MICTFFGNSDCSVDIYPLLEKTILDLIQNKKIHDFLVGNHGNYDYFVYTVLKKIKALYPYVRYSVVLAYMPRKDMLFSEKETILPDDIETVPKRYCIATAIGIWLKRRTVWLLVSDAAVMRKNMCSLRRKKERPLSIYENNPKRNPRCSKRSVGGFCLSESGLTAISVCSVFSINKHGSARMDHPCRTKFVSFVSHCFFRFHRGVFRTAQPVSSPEILRAAPIF